MYEGKEKCPYCKKLLTIEIDSETIEPGVKAETKKVVTLGKDLQTKLTGVKRTGKSEL